MNRLHHLALGSADVERLAAFYEEALGLPVVARHGNEQGVLRSIWLDLGGSLLMLEHTEEPRPRVATLGAGLFLLALRVAAHELPALESRLAARGHAIESRTAFTSYLRDPDGNRIGLSHYPDVPLGSDARPSTR
jgi:catechol 2,3-dioxygenase-like lactoylglutathione lyase family enzyme